MSTAVKLLQKACSEAADKMNAAIDASERLRQQLANQETIIRIYRNEVDALDAAIEAVRASETEANDEEPAVGT